MTIGLRFSCSLRPKIDQHQFSHNKGPLFFLSRGRGREGLVGFEGGNEKNLALKGKGVKGKGGSTKKILQILQRGHL